jgi:hypothetical protein
MCDFLILRLHRIIDVSIRIDSDSMVKFPRAAKKNNGTCIFARKIDTFTPNPSISTGSSPAESLLSVRN